MARERRRADFGIPPKEGKKKQTGDAHPGLKAVRDGNGGKKKGFDLAFGQADTVDVKRDW
jgi:hypothetical protein